MEPEARKFATALPNLLSTCGGCVVGAESDGSAGSQL